MKLSIVIPAYNEERTLEGVVQGLCEEIQPIEPSFEIVVVNNGSTDDTEQVLEAIKKKFSQVRSIHIANEGYGNGVLAGLQAAKGEVLGWMHADNQLYAKDLARVYEKLQEEHLHACKITRTSREEHMVRLVQSRVFNALFRVLYGSISSDVNASPKLMRRELYEAMNLRSKGWFLDAEAVIGAKRLKLAFGEVPVVWHARQGGASKVQVRTSLELLGALLWFRSREFFIQVRNSLQE